MPKLTPKQKAFADYFIKSGNATQAAIKAGYSEKTARAIAAENLTKLDVQEYIQEQNKAIESSRIADMKEVKEFWTDILRARGVDVKERLKASELIAKTNGAFIERVQHTGSVDGNIIIEIGGVEFD